jgi:hypothetical protein
MKSRMGRLCVLLSADTPNCGDMFHGDPSNFVIPAKAGIQDVWVATMAPTVLDARFRGHDDGLDQSSIKNTSP